MKMVVVRDPTKLFKTGDTYEPADIHAWLDDGELPEGLVLKNGRYLRVTGNQLMPCNADGRLIRSKRGRPRGLTRLTVLQALADALEADKHPSYRELAETVGVPHSTISYHLNMLESDGLVGRGEYAHRSTLLTERGWQKANELRGEKR